jgi:plasmid stability protein
MPQLLVRDIPQVLVQKLKRRAVDHGVSAEEEHRRILREALSTKRTGTPTLMEFLLGTEVAPKVQLPLKRGKGIESRDIGF